MDYFYKDCVQTLLKPIVELPTCGTYKEPILPLTREETNRFVYLCDLVHNLLQQHSFRSHFYIMSSNILPSIATLFKSKDKHLRHCMYYQPIYWVDFFILTNSPAAFRIFRLLLKQNNSNTNKQIMKHGVLKPILDLTIQESVRDNLLSCSCQEYFDFMRRV